MVEENTRCKLTAADLQELVARARASEIIQGYGEHYELISLFQDNLKNFTDQVIFTIDELLVEKTSQWKTELNMLVDYNLCGASDDLTSCIVKNEDSGYMDAELHMRSLVPANLAPYWKFYNLRSLVCYLNHILLPRIRMEYEIRGFEVSDTCPPYEVFLEKPGKFTVSISWGGFEMEAKLREINNIEQARAILDGVSCHDVLA